MSGEPRAAWGGGAKEACPHCGAVRARNHQRLCEKNPNRDMALVERLRAGGRKRAAQDAPALVVDTDLKPTGEAVQIPPDVNAAMNADLAVARPPPRPTTVPIKTAPANAQADAFMRARIEELRNTKAPPAVTPASGQVSAKPKTTWSFTPSPLLIKLALGFGALASVGFLWAAWRRKKGESKAQAPPPAMRETYKGPRAWTPDPSAMPVAKDDVVPSTYGGGYIPSPETAWDQKNAASLRGGR